MEMVCDEIATTRTQAPVELAGALVRLKRLTLSASPPAMRPAASSLFGDSKDNFEKRVERVLSMADQTEFSATEKLSRSCIRVAVTMVVANEATDRPAPFPPLRIEMTTAPGSKPSPVLVRDPSGACTFTPRAGSIAPGGSVVFNGSSPAIDPAAAPGAAGRIEVNASERRFSLVAPVP